MPGEHLTSLGFNPVIASSAACLTHPSRPSTNQPCPPRARDLLQARLLLSSQVDRRHLFPPSCMSQVRIAMEDGSGLSRIEGHDVFEGLVLDRGEELQFSRAVGDRHATTW